MRTARGSTTVVALLCAFAGCSGSEDRSATVVDTLVRADLSLLRNRPELVGAKYRAMADEPFAYLRGSFAVFVRDALVANPPLVARELALPDVLVVGMGDAHLENFGTLRAADGTFSLEPNDLDAAERYPYHWDLVRLCTSLAVGTRLLPSEGGGLAPLDPASEQAVVAAAARAYARELVRLADGGSEEPITDGQDVPALRDLFARSLEGAVARSELEELSVYDGASRRFLRGPVEGDPTHLLRDVSASAAVDVRRALEEYAASLPAASGLDLLDVVQEVGSGVASMPRVRLLVLVGGATTGPEDDVVLELKELTDAPARGWRAPGVLADDVAGRVRRAAELLWSRPDSDPTWSTASFLSLPVQIRAETDAHRTLRVRRLSGALATSSALQSLAAALGKRLAAMHARSSGGSAIAALVRPDADRFAQRIGEATRAYATTTLEDYESFRRALVELGPTLGVRAVEDEPLLPSLRPLLEGP